MAPTLIAPDLYALDLGGVNAYLIRGPKGLTLIDSGYPGSAERIAQQLGALGHDLGALTQIVVTHCHPDHAGSLAELQARTGAQTWMHPLDAAMVRAGQAMRERLSPTPGVVNAIIYRVVIASAARTIAPARVDHEVEDGEELPFASGLRVIHAPGHSAGQIALLWPRHGGVLFVADSAINVVGLALFPAYEDLAEGQRTLARLGGLDAAIACFGHGRPLRRDAAARLRTLAARGKP
jgi:glyoxylase-like metal-dependent hydrolase (beta-lactamase superfamily II)